MKVLITTSGVGSRLGELTRHTNKALVRVGNKPVISYAVENYPADSEYVITLGHYGEHVKEFLPLAYPERKFIFVPVDPYRGVGSSLAYSMLCARQQLQEPFIFHVCDTIIDQSITSVGSNWLGGGKSSVSGQYRTFSLTGDKVRCLHDKGETRYDYVHLGIWGMQDWECFWKNLEAAYRFDPTASDLSDCAALQLCLKECEFGYRQFNWRDAGNLDALAETRLKVKDDFAVLDKPDESIFFFDDFVIKFFYDTTICRNRVTRAAFLKGKVPDILGHGEHFYKYRRAEGDLLARVVNTVNFSKLLDWADLNLWRDAGIDSAEFHEVCKSFYFAKTRARLDKFHRENNLVDKAHIINGVPVPSIADMLVQIDERWLCRAHPCGFHGDFILDNILLSGSDFVLLDWRQDFGGQLVQGDAYYDLGKLNHNLVLNHDIIRAELFSVNYKGDDIVVDVLRSARLTECQKLLHTFVVKRGWDLKKVEVLTALIWLNMAPLHDKKFGLFLYYFGKYNLWRQLCS